MRGPLLLLLLLGGLLGVLMSPLPPPDLLLWNGIALFAREDWQGARGQLWGALRSLSELQGVKVRCGEECRLRGSWGPYLEDAVLKRADCLLDCERQQLGEPSLYRLTQETENVFHRGQLYNYLQVVHYKLEEVDEAAAAAFTFYIRNPFHEQIQDDIQRYRKMKNVREQSFRDLEQSQCQTLYSEAISLLSDSKLRAAALRLEDSLTACLSELDSCRSLCEGTRELENEVHRDISEVIAEYYVSVLQCKQRCVLGNSLLPRLKHSKEDAVISCLSSLLDTYTKLEDWDSAAEIAHSLLLFDPQNETTRERLRGYEERLHGKSVGKGREAIVSYVRRALSEKKLLYYAMENMNISFADPDSWTPEEIIPESLRERVRKEKEAEEQKVANLPYEDVTVTFSPHQMNGTTRVTLDGVINEDECRILLDLAQMAGGSGSGFRGRQSPHTPRERIQGLTLMRAIQMASTGTIDLSHPRLYYRASERARILAQSYFGTEKLYSSYTHLVCRSAVDGEQEGRSDLSHPVHADNCILDPEEKECWREPPAYVHRDFSGLLYLNNDFKGGDLFFTEQDAETVTAEIRPRCGRLVLFSSGGENAHGVHAVTQGTRCAVALWFTKSVEHAEQERSQAQSLLLGTASATQSKDGEVPTKNGRETTSNSEEPERPAGRRQKKQEHRKFTDEL